MIVETTGERGIVRLPPNLSFRQDIVMVKMQVPDQELDAPLTETLTQTSVASITQNGGLRAGIDVILGPYKEQPQLAQPFSAQDFERERVSEVLKAQGIPTAVYYPKCLHEQSVFEPVGYRWGDFPEVERASREVLSQPMHSYLTEREQDRVCVAVRIGVNGGG